MTEAEAAYQAANNNETKNLEYAVANGLTTEEDVFPNEAKLAGTASDNGQIDEKGPASIPSKK